MPHVSVLSQEIIAALHPRKGGVFVDGTFGGGGHSRLLAKLIGKSGRLISFDADSTVFNPAIVKELNGYTTFTPVVSNFRNMGDELHSMGIEAIDGSVFDLGLSSTQLEESGRGFSFMRDEPLGMTFSVSPLEGETTAESIVNHWKEETIAVILKGFGEERFARAIAKGIVEGRKAGPITTTGALTEIIRKCTPSWYRNGKTHFATKTFQALRMATNDELGAIEAGITAVVPYLAPKGVIAVISFHSLEDRLVKTLFRRFEKEDKSLTILTKKPLVPSEGEVRANPRSRSAKLRIAEKVRSEAKKQEKKEKKKATNK